MAKRRWTRRRTGVGSGGAAARHAAHYAAVLGRADDLYVKDAEGVLEGIALFDLERWNLEVGQGFATENAGRDDTAARLCSMYPNAGAYVLALRLHPRDWVVWLDGAVAAAKRLNDRRAEGAHFGNLGNAYAELGETRRAIKFYEQRLEIAREIGDRRGEGNALGNLGVAYAALGESRRAIEFQEQALEISREIGNRRGEGQDLGNLGLSYGDLGEIRRAIEFYEQSLKIAREIGDRRVEGGHLGNLGIAYAGVGETRRAIEFYEQHLAIAREIGDRRGESTALYNLADVLMKVGERVRAIELGERSLEILLEIEHAWADKVRTALARWRSGAWHRTWTAIASAWSNRPRR